MVWSTGWWKRIPSAIDVGRAALAGIVGRTVEGRALRDDGDALMLEIEPMLRALVGDTLGIKPERIDLHASLVQDLGIDPLDVLDLMTRIESIARCVVPRRRGRRLAHVRGFRAGDACPALGAVGRRATARPRPAGASVSGGASARHGPGPRARGDAHPVRLRDARRGRRERRMAPSTARSSCPRASRPTRSGCSTTPCSRRGSTACGPRFAVAGDARSLGLARRRDGRPHAGDQCRRAAHRAACGRSARLPERRARHDGAAPRVERLALRARDPCRPRTDQSSHRRVPDHRPRVRARPGYAAAHATRRRAGAAGRPRRHPRRGRRAHHARQRRARRLPRCRTCPHPVRLDARARATRTPPWYPSKCASRPWSPRPRPEAPSVP